MAIAVAACPCQPTHPGGGGDCLVVGGSAGWQEPPGALSEALQAVGWSLRRNDTRVQALHSPVVAPEVGYLSALVL
jgi:hypothetical protein